MGRKAGTPFSNWHVQQTLCFCSFRAFRILATVALSWSSCSSWLMMPNRLLQEISQTDNYIEAPCCCWHSNVFARAIPCRAVRPRYILGCIFLNASCTLFHTLLFIMQYKRKRSRIWKMCRDFQGSHTQSSFLKEVDFSTKANAQKKRN